MSAVSKLLDRERKQEGKCVVLCDEVSEESVCVWSHVMTSMRRERACVVSCDDIYEKSVCVWGCECLTALTDIA